MGLDRHPRGIQQAGGFMILRLQGSTLKVLRWEERDKRLIIKEAQWVA